MAPTSTFSNTVRPSNGRGTWAVRAMPARARRVDERPVMSRPSYRTVPASARNSPATRFNSVVLPAPFGPTMPSASSATANERSSITRSAPNRFSRLLTSRAGVIDSLRVRVDAGSRAGDRLQVARFRDIRVILVRDDDEVVLELTVAPHPLAADERGLGNVPRDPLPAPVDLAD